MVGGVRAARVSREIEKDTPSLRASTAAYGDADAIDARVGDADANNTNANANAALERISSNIASGPARARIECDIVVARLRGGKRHPARKMRAGESRQTRLLAGNDARGEASSLRGGASRGKMSGA